jgi:ubiquinone/menaquinone biosynthesis C-methylase UbiE
MGLYASQVLPRLIDRVCGARSTHERRRHVCAGLSGRVVELGFGSGTNVPFYPPEVQWVAAVEPNDTAWHLAAARIAASPVPVERCGPDGAHIPLADASCDAALSTWTLCTIPDVETALAEVRRVLKPGGTLHFVEHGLAPAGDEQVRRWQHRLDPIQRRVAGGCHLARPIAALITGAGFELLEVEEFYEPGAPKFMSADTMGIAG